MVNFTQGVRRLYSCTDDYVRAHAHDMLVQGRALRTALAGKNPALTVAWFDAMEDELSACDSAPLHPERQAPGAIERQDRDADVKESRGILQDIFFYARKAYPAPTQTATVASFGTREYTHAGTSTPKMLDVMRLTFRRASDPAIQPVLEAVGLKPTELARLGVLSGEVLEIDTRHAVAVGDARVGTQEYVERLNSLWSDRLRVLNQTANRAFRLDVARRRLFRLYDPAYYGETHELTVRRSHPHSFALDAPVVDGTVYEFRVVDGGTATGRLSRSERDDAPGPGGHKLDPMTRTDHALRLTGAEIGAAGDFLTVECLTGDRLHVRVRVLPEAVPSSEE